MQNIPEQETMVKLLAVLFPASKIYLFGSQARGDFRVSSDIDIAIDNGAKISLEMIARANNIIEALNIPKKVDLVDFHRVPEAMQKAILRDGIIWKS